MAEFNPYQSWLKVSTNGEPPNYYQLLGLPEFEENLQTVSKAAEKQLSRLLAINPEKHRPLWQKLINDLAEAQSTLTHPEHKANYDNRLRGLAVSAASAPEPVPAPTTSAPTMTAPSMPASSSAGPSSTPFCAAPYQAPPYQAPAPAAPPSYSPPQGYPAFAQAAFQNSPQSPAAQPYPAPPQYGQPGNAPPPSGQAPYVPPSYRQPVYGQPQYGQPDYGQPPQMQPGYGQPAYAPPNYGQPTYGQSSGPPVQAPPVYGQPAYHPTPPNSQPPSSYGYAPPAASIYEATAAHDPHAPTSMGNPMAPFGSVAAHGGGGYGYAGPATPDPFSTSMNRLAPVNSFDLTPGSSRSYVQEKTKIDKDSEPGATPNPARATRPKSPAKFLVAAFLVIVAIFGGLAVNAKYGGKHHNDPVAKTEHPTPPNKGKEPQEIVPVSTPTEPKSTDPEPVQPTPPKPEPTEPVKPIPPKPEPLKPVPPKPEPMQPEPAKPEPMVASPAEQQVIFAKLAEVRRLLGQREFADAKRELNQVKALATTPDMQELQMGMELVVDYTEQFWQAVQTSMRTLDGEIMIGSSLANVVNSEAGEITFRIAGVNKHSKFESLPPGLALAIAKKWFGNKSADNAASNAVLGAFYFVSKTSSIDEARKYWREAGQGGVDVKYMLILLDKPAIHGK